MKSWLMLMTCLLTLLTDASSAQGNSTPDHRSDSAPAGAELRYVVYISRHGVRSPTGISAQYNLYSAGLWPEWPVQPGYLTAHGFHLMELFGAYDREQLAKEGLLHADGCTDASTLTFYADSDQRTRETGKALAQGLMPGCSVPVVSLPQGTTDPLFHSNSNAGKDSLARARAAIAGRMGGAPDNLTQAYYPQIEALDQILATCGTQLTSSAKRVSLFDIPATFSEGNGDRVAELKGPLNTASTLAENFLLEYAEGMDSARVGWGCVHRSEIESLIALHTAATDFTQRTPEIARAQAAPLLKGIGLSIEQAVGGKAVHGAFGKPADRALFLIGHDTNIENIAGTLNLTWIVDGRRDDTPPGGALIFEIWRQYSGGEYSVRTYYTAQTLEQMRASTTITPSNPPERISVFVPGCSNADMSCSLSSFLKLLGQRSK